MGRTRNAVSPLPATVGSNPTSSVLTNFSRRDIRKIRQSLLLAGAVDLYHLKTPGYLVITNMSLFFFFAVGVLELFIVTAWTKVVVGSRVVMSGAVTFVNVLIWYLVLETIISDINNWPLVLVYALGCALGTMIGVSYLDRKSAPVDEMADQSPKLIEHESVSIA